MAEHDRMQVDPILIDQTEFGEAVRQARASNFAVPSRSALIARIADLRSPPMSVALGPTDVNVRETTHFG